MNLGVVELLRRIYLVLLCALALPLFAQPVAAVITITVVAATTTARGAPLTNVAGTRLYWTAGGVEAWADLGLAGSPVSTTQQLRPDTDYTFTHAAYNSLGEFAVRSDPVVARTPRLSDPPGKSTLVSVTIVLR